jgi:hypothetical protein
MKIVVAFALALIALACYAQIPQSPLAPGSGSTLKLYRAGDSPGECAAIEPSASPKDGLAGPKTWAALEGR